MKFATALVPRTSLGGARCWTYGQWELVAPTCRATGPILPQSTGENGREPQRCPFPGRFCPAGAWGLLGQMEGWVGSVNCMWCLCGMIVSPLSAFVGFHPTRCSSSPPQLLRGGFVEAHQCRRHWMVEQGLVGSMG